MKILYIAWGFPPMGGNGIQRTLKFVKYLPANGVEVAVLASSDAKQGNLKDEKLLKEIPESVRVYRVTGAGWMAGVLKVRDKAKSSARAQAAPGAKAAGGGRMSGWVLRRIAAPLWRAFLNTIMLPDLARPWADNAMQALPRILEGQNFDAVYVTGPPFSALLVAEAAAKRAGVPLVMEYRDPWCIPSGRPTHWLKHRIERRWEARIIRFASKVIFDNPVSRDAHVSFYGIPPGKTAIIPNGYDPADRIGVDPLREPGKILFGYSGSFTSDGRTPRFFLAALRKALDRHPEWRGKIKAKFVGQFWPDDREYIASLGLAEHAETTGFLPHSESIRHVAGFDVALVIGETCKGNMNTVPEKIYEYMMWEKPMLALVPIAGASGRLIRQYGLGQVTGVDDIDAIADGIGRMVAASLEGRALADRLPGTERFDRMRLTEELGGILREAAGQAPTEVTEAEPHDITGHSR
jgi:glycosyltransferase involved in cell wall biosynthesis